MINFEITTLITFLPGCVALQNDSPYIKGTFGNDLGL
ncbi:hypothetical protein BH11BAC1_BH11BAC1_26470 [soil metagenome]